MTGPGLGALAFATTDSADGASGGGIEQQAPEQSPPADPPKEEPKDEPPAGDQSGGGGSGGDQSGGSGDTGQQGSLEGATTQLAGTIVAGGDHCDGDCDSGDGHCDSGDECDDDCDDDCDCEDEPPAPPAVSNSISGFKYGDVDDSDAVDSSGPGLSGWTIKLFKKDSSGTYRTTTTGADGSYSFANLPSGKYYVTEDISSKPGWTQKHTPDHSNSSNYIDMTSGSTTHTGLNFFNYKPSKITVFKYYEKQGDDCDGHEGHVDEPLDHVWFTLSGGPDGISQREHTGDDGTFTWDDLKPGTYTLTEEPPDGFYAPGGNTSSVTVDLGECKTVDIKNEKTVDLDVHKYHVQDHDHEANADYEGVWFRLTGPGYDKSDETDHDGDLTFTGLIPGSTYTLTETLPDGHYAPDGTTHVFTAVAGTDKSYSIANADAASVEITKYDDANNNKTWDTGEAYLDREFKIVGAGGTFEGDTGADGKLTFGNLKPGTYTLTEENMPPGWTVTADKSMSDFVLASGDCYQVSIANFLPATINIFKFNDLNDDGEQAGAGEDAMAGINFTLTGPGGPYAGVTDGDGRISFTGLVAGKYTLSETLPGWFVKPTMPFDITVVAGQVVNQTVSNTQYGTIVVKKFNDLDGDAEKDSGEDWIAQEFTLTGTDKSGPITERKGTTEGADGYGFAGLRPGTYRLSEVLAAGWSQSTDVLDTDIFLAAGETRTIVVGNWMPIRPFTGPDLGIHKSANKSVVVPGQEVVYTLTYVNIGESNATNFVIVDDYDETKMDVVDASGGTVSGGKITWNIAGPLAHDATAVITYTLRAKTGLTTGTVIDNSATISISDLQDPTMDDNFDTVRITVGDEPYSPYTEEEDSLPFTGADVTLLLLAAAALALAGALIRRSANRAVA
jgi:uncharacterized repeat protein (TIGR01451 family)